MGTLLVQAAKDRSKAYPADSKPLAGTLPTALRKTSRKAAHTEAQADATGVSSTGPPPGKPPGAASGAPLAEAGQQTPIIVIEQHGRYLVIDGHQRLASLQQLGQDTVHAVVREMIEAEALVLERSLRTRQPETALEQGWLLAEMESRLGCSIEELARRFGRSKTWVASRLALVETLPQPVQQRVREGQLAAAIALRYRTPVARVNAEHCQRLAEAFATAAQPWTTRQAAELYRAWRHASRALRERIVAAPDLYRKAQQPASSFEKQLHQLAALAQRALDEQPSPPPESSASVRRPLARAIELLHEL